MNLHQRNDGVGENSVRTKAGITYFHEEILPEGVEILRKQRMVEKHSLSRLRVGYLRSEF